MKKKIRFTVIGAGHGGKAIAADLARKRFRVALFNRTPLRIEEIRTTKEIEIEYEDGTIFRSHLETVTSNISEAIEGADIIMVVIPASGHKDVAEMLAPHLRSGQIIVLNPGRTGGALQFRQILDSAVCSPDVYIAETETFLFISRSTGPTQAHIFHRKNGVYLAALPAIHTNLILKKIHPAYPQFIPARNVFQTSIQNLGAIFHPALALLNAGWIEHSKGNFQFYIEGTTRSTSRIIGMLDKERMSIAKALKLDICTAREWFKNAYSAEGGNLYEAIQANPGYQGIKAPRNLRHRYIFEDVPFSLVPMSSIGSWMGVKTEMINSMIRIASVMLETDYFKIGRTIETMGLKGKSLNEVESYIQNGKLANV